MSASNAEFGTAATALVADADDTRRVLAAALVRRLGFQAVEVAGGQEALDVVEHEPPALAVLNVDLPVTSGYAVCRALREAHGDRVPIILVSERRIEPADEVAGFLLGADEYFATPLRPDLFLARVRRLICRTVPAEDRGRALLTPRERDVLQLLVQGIPPGRIADRLCITAKTTSTHIEHILRKLGAHTQAQAVAFAIRDRLVDTPV